MKLPLKIGAALVALVSASSPRVARAEDAPRTDPLSSEHKAPFPIFSVDGLGVAVDHRFGLQVEYVFAANDSVTAYPWYLVSQSSGPHGFFVYGDPQFDSAFTQYDTQTRAFGLDLQYRHYFTGSRVGGQGFFLGPGVEAQHFTTLTNTTYFADGAVNPPALRQEWSYLGLSLDAGAQIITSFGATFGGSLGAQYRFVVGDLDDSKTSFEWELSNGPGLRPRARLWIGWAFL
jgi:hypothetical protein